MEDPWDPFSDRSSEPSRVAHGPSSLSFPNSAGKRGIHHGILQIPPLLSQHPGGNHQQIPGSNRETSCQKGQSQELMGFLWSPLTVCPSLLQQLTFPSHGAAQAGWVRWAPVGFGLGILSWNLSSGVVSAGDCSV